MIRIVVQNVNRFFLLNLWSRRWRQSHSAQLQEFWRRVVARFGVILKLAFPMDSTFFA